ncbi:MAG: hypothetical protein GX778_04280 [Erysipelothrix sp.]|nr:hypothetical protein [Erysipelothrix sp.]
MINEKLVEILVEEVQFQNNENKNNNEKYRQQAKYHTKLVEQMHNKVEKYPHFALAILQRHIDKEDLIFGQEINVPKLTPHEEGRIYSLVRCKHMIRLAKERADKHE